MGRRDEEKEKGEETMQNYLRRGQRSKAEVNPTWVSVSASFDKHSKVAQVSELLLSNLSKSNIVSKH